MKVLLIVPRTIGRYTKPTIPHAGIGYIAAILLKNGHNVEILDMRVHPHIKDSINKINKFKPDMIGLTSPSRGYIIAYNLIKEIKKHYNIPIVIGGPHASTIEEQILKDTPVDYAVMGEGEYTILDLVNSVKPSEIKGLIWKDEGKIIKNTSREWIENLDTLPFPAFELFELDKYMDKKIPIVTSRGCPYRCVYCSINLTMGHKFRARSAKNVVDELEYWVKKGYNYFGFNDDCFTFDMQRAKDICDLIIKRGLKIKWELRNGIRIDKLDEELMRKMRNAGCVYISFGIESAVQDVLNKMRKGLSIEHVREKVLLAEKLKIKHGGFFIIGLPGDNFERFKQTLDFALSLPFDEVRFYNAIPYPGTELFGWIKENGRFVRDTHEYLNMADAWSADPIFETDDFKAEERKKAFEIAEKIF